VRLGDFFPFRSLGQDEGVLPSAAFGADCDHNTRGSVTVQSHVSLRNDHAKAVLIGILFFAFLRT